MSAESSETSVIQAIGPSDPSTLPGDSALRSELKRLCKLPDAALHKTLVDWRLGEDEGRRAVATELLQRRGPQSVEALLREAAAPGQSVSHRLKLLEALSDLGQPLKPGHWMVLSGMGKFGPEVRAKVLVVLSRMGYHCDHGSGGHADAQDTRAGSYRLMLDLDSGLLCWREQTVGPSETPQDGQAASKRPLPGLGMRGMLRLLKYVGEAIVRPSYTGLATDLGVSAETTRSCAAFAAELGLVRLEGNRVAATPTLLEFTHRYRLSAAKGLASLAPVLRQSWAWSALEGRLSAGPIPEDELVGLLARAAGAGYEERRQLLFVAEILVALGLLGLDAATGAYSAAMRMRTAQPREHLLSDAAYPSATAVRRR